MRWLAALSSFVELRQPVFLLLALLALPTYVWSRRGGGRLMFSSLALIPKERSLRQRLSGLPAALLALSIVALAVAMAGPRLPDRSTRVQKQGIALMLVVDTSSSMQALDLSDAATPDKERTRLDAVKEVFSDFVTGGHGLPGRPDDLVGIVSFARYADTRCPLTLDHDNLRVVASQLQIVDRQEEDGTALGDGLGLALERLRESSAKSRVAILLTDGVSNAGEMAPARAAELARTIGVKVYTVGAGTNGMAPVRVRDPFGRSMLQRMPVEIDEDGLREIAKKSGGRYFRATDAEALRQVYRDIDALERSELTAERFRRYREFYPHALLLGLLLALLAWLLNGTLLRRLP